MFEVQTLFLVKKNQGTVLSYCPKHYSVTHSIIEEDEKEDELQLKAMMKGHFIPKCQKLLPKRCAKFHNFLSKDSKSHQRVQWHIKQKGKTVMIPLQPFLSTQNLEYNGKRLYRGKTSGLVWLSGMSN